MSYLRKIKYRIVPDDSFDIVYNCSGCGCKTSYKNTNRFRVNANGNKLDVWLIYQCSKCKHTKNLAIYERQNPTRIQQEEYQLFLANDEELAKEYGRNFQFFMKNHVEVDHEAIRYHYEMEAEEKDITFQKGDLLMIENSYGLRIRSEKLVSEVLGISRSQTKKRLETGQLIMRQEGRNIEIAVC